MTSASPMWLFAEPFLFGAFLLMLRMFGLVTVLPGLTQGAFISPTRVLVVTFLTVFVFTALGMPAVAVPAQAPTAVMMLVREFILGSALGFFIRLLFAIADVTGAIAGMALSLSMAGMVDPATGEQTTAVSNLLGMGGLLLFVAMGGHNEAITGLLINLHLFPVGSTGLIGFDVEALSTLGHGLFAASLQIAAPIIVVTTLINVALGLMARAAPQVNIFAVGFSVLLIAGLSILDTAAIGVYDVFEDRLPTLAEDMNFHLQRLEGASR